MAATLIYGHRGAYHFAPENTLTSFQLAVDMGADGVEFDIQLSKDGEVVVCHDETLARTSDGAGFVRDYTLAELKGFNFNKRGITKPLFMEIPTLRETLDVLKDTHVDINIELKTGLYYYENIEQKAYDIVSEYGLHKRVVWSSFNHISVEKIKNIDDNARTALLCGGGILLSPLQAKAMGAEALHVRLNQIAHPEMVERCKASNIELRVWTVDKAEDLKRVYKLGLDAVFTNRIDTSKQVRSEYPR